MKMDYTKPIDPQNCALILPLFIAYFNYFHLLAQTDSSLVEKTNFLIGAFR